MKQYLFFAIIATVACGCDDGLFESVIDENPKLVEQLMTGATETLTIGPNTFVLEAFLWRDFMPILEETNFDGRSMIAINWLVDVNSVVVPANISLVRQHVIYGNLVWTSAYEDEAPAPSLPPHKLERVSRNGPKWGPDIYVDIVAEVRDSQTGRSYLIKLKGVHVVHTS